MTTTLSRYSQVSQALMVGHLTPYDPAFQERLRQLESMLGQQGAYAAIYNILLRQATLMAFIRNFWILTIACLLCIPLVFLFSKVKQSKAAAAVH